MLVLSCSTLAPPSSLHLPTTHPILAGTLRTYHQIWPLPGSQQNSPRGPCCKSWSGSYLRLARIGLLFHSGTSRLPLPPSFHSQLLGKLRERGLRQDSRTRPRGRFLAGNPRHSCTVKQKVVAVLVAPGDRSIPPGHTRWILDLLPETSGNRKLQESCRCTFRRSSCLRGTPRLVDSKTFPLDLLPASQRPPPPSPQRHHLFQRLQRFP
mmetsp:Transcript_45545/g.81956  ORF Transcript_45545/g.81956 Transcript_45545/m.81956 type:complete len:209 (-) Transcript_45545:1251-1877(-)